MENVKNVDEAIRSSGEVEGKNKNKIIFITIFSQFLITLLIKILNIPEFKSNQNWTGIIMGWVCLYFGIKRRKEIVQLVSKTVGNLYLTFGIIFLFAGALPGGWIVAMCHQIYGFTYQKGLKSAIRLTISWTLAMFALNFIMFGALKLLGIDPFELK